VIIYLVISLNETSVTIFEVMVTVGLRIVLILPVDGSAISNLSSPAITSLENVYLEGLKILYDVRYRVLRFDCKYAEGLILESGIVHTVRTKVSCHLASSLSMRT
jgi:hypothetical protein